MGKIIIALGGGGGLDTDECTADKAQVLSGYTAGVHGEDDPAPGTMPEKGAWTGNVGMNGSVSIPEGHHNGQGKVNGPVVTQRGAVSAALNCGGAYTVPEGYHNGAGRITANSLASQTSANAGSGHILSGYTAWVNGVKVTGNVAVQSILSFSAAVYSSTAITFTWKNPAKGPFSGVIIVGKTGSYPTSISDGTRWFMGSGNNTAASGSSSTTVSGFTSGTACYFRAFSYAIQNNGEWINGTSYTASATTTKGQQVLTSSGTFTVPAGVRSIDVFLVGGGGGGGAGEYSGSSPYYSGGGAGSGYTNTIKSIAVTPGLACPYTVGAGGAGGTGNAGNGRSGGVSSITINGTSYSANGGNGNGTGASGGKGGSGGGGSSEYKPGSGGNGGSNGSDGGYGTSSNGKPNTGGKGGSGQGTTTRAFGENSNTLYAGGGGAGAGYYDYYESGGTSYYPTAGSGGDGGGGRGGGRLGSNYTGASSGIANTGGGGGGGWAYYREQPGGSGGSGICIIRWGY